MSELAVTDVAARERPVAASPSRVRCLRCAMPRQGGLARCWSCGLNPGREAPPGGQAGMGPWTSDDADQPRVRARPVLLGLSIVLVVVLGWALLGTSTGTDGQVRGLAERLRGETWPRAEVRGASADFPTPPAARTVAPGPGLPRGAEALVATAADGRVELLVAEVADPGTQVDGRAAAEQLVEGYAAAVAGRVVQHLPVSGPRAALHESLLESPLGPIRVRVTLLGTTACLLSASGSAKAFERFAASFEGPAAR